MTREIKFGFFDKKNKAISAGFSLQEIQKFASPVEDRIALQFTGLKDNHENNIYEGNIIEFWSYNEKHDEVDTGIAVIQWDEFRYCFKADLSDCKQRKGRKNLSRKDFDKLPPVEELTGRSEFTSRNLGDLGSVRIIGNIYQFPELLANNKE